MLPQILQQLQGAQTNSISNLQQIKQLMQTVKMASNPDAAMSIVAQQNPQVKTVIDELRKSGGTAKDAFYAIAKRKGIDPDEIISALK